jgi:hypothetical protein
MLKFATPVFGIKAKRARASAKLNIKFATPVFGIKAKQLCGGFAGAALRALTISSFGGRTREPAAKLIRFIQQIEPSYQIISNSYAITQAAKAKDTEYLRGRKATPCIR